MPDVYALSATFTPAAGTSAATTLAQVLDGWVRTGERRDLLPGLDPSAGWVHRTPDGGIVRWEVFADEASGRSLHELTWRHPHHFNPNPYKPTDGEMDLWWSTRVSCAVGADGTAALAVRIANTGPAATEPGALRTSRPRLVPELARRGTLISDGAVYGRAPGILTAADLPSFVRYDLADPTRRTPVVLLTPDPDGRYPVAPNVVADELLTLARVYVIATPADTFALTDTLGRRELSVFNGAMRVYLPGFRQDADAAAHPLVLPRRLAERGVRHQIASRLALHTLRRYDDDPRFALLRDERAAQESARHRTVEQELQRAAAAARDSHDYRELAEEYARENARLAVELETARARLEDAESRARGLDAERRRLAYALSQRDGGRLAGQTETAEASAPPVVAVGSVLDAVEQAAALFGDHLLFLPSARATAEASPYSKPDEVFETLQRLARLAARRAAPGGLGRPFREACAQERLEYRATISETTSKKHRRQYEFVGDDGRSYQCYEHLVLGTSYNPEHCLRVYFTSRVDGEPRMVVGHVGRHLDVATTT